MPTDEYRIKMLKERIAARTQKLEKLAAFQKTKALNEADEAAMAKLADEYTKKLANRQRIDDNHAKVLIGAAALQLSAPDLLRTMLMLRVFLVGRHREFLVKWFAQRGMDITRPTTTDERKPDDQSAASTAAIKSPTTLINPVGVILENVVHKMDEGAFSLVGPEILQRATEADRAVLEEWYAKRDHDRQGSKKSQENSQDRQTPPNNTESEQDQNPS